jgi:hypothetical protein
VPRPPATFSLALREPPDLLALGPSGKPLFVLTRGNIAREGEPATALFSSAAAASVAGEHVAVAGETADGKSSVALVPLARDGRSIGIPLPSRATALAWNETARTLHVAAADGHVRRLDPRTGDVLEDVTFENGVRPGDMITRLAASDDGAALTVGTQQGRILVRAPRAGAPVEVASLHAAIGCLQWARSGRAVVASAGAKAFVVGTDLGVAFSFWGAPATIVGCARSPDEDRFSFAAADGTAWVKPFDFAGVAESYLPPDPAAPAALPTPANWKGLPVGLVR